MTTTPEYDAILARKIREREEGNKGEIELTPYEVKCHECGGIFPRGTGHTHGYITKTGRKMKGKPGRKSK